MDLNLFGEIDEAQSKWSTKGRNTIFNIVKKAGTEKFWPRLTKEDKKDQSIRVRKRRFAETLQKKLSTIGGL